MTTVPLKLALRDLDIEAHDVTGADAYIYNAMYDLMNRIIDTVNLIDPTLNLYREIFRGKDQAAIFQSENFYIQNDGMYQHTENSQDEYRLIWRDFVIGWYKHPRRCLQANRELSGAEQALLLLEFRTEVQAHLQRGMEMGTHRYVLDKPYDTITPMKAAIDKLRRNGVSGARAHLPNISLLMEPPLSMPHDEIPKVITDFAQTTPWPPGMTVGGRPLNEVFGSYVGAPPPERITDETLDEMMARMSKSREESKRILTDSGLIGPHADRNRFGEQPFNLPILKNALASQRKHRMTQGEFGDYEAASMYGKTVRANWERIKAEGIEIIKEEDKTPGEKMGIGDLSVMFMYPNEIEPIDLDKLNLTPELEERYKHMREDPALDSMRAMAANFKPVMVVPRHDPNLTLMAEAAARDFKMPILMHRDIGGEDPVIPNIIGMIHSINPPRGDGAFLKSNMLSFMMSKNRQLQTPGSFTLNLEMPMDDYPPLITIDSMAEVAGEDKGGGTAPQFFVRNGRVRPKKLADMVKFVLFAMYHPLLNSKE